ncbi:MAG: hypothetical protein AB8B63_24665 [Granulosicoccus sp.]
MERPVYPFSDWQIVDFSAAIGILSACRNLQGFQIYIDTMGLVRIHARKKLAGLLLLLWVLLAVLALGGIAIGFSAIFKAEYFAAIMLVLFNLFLFAAAVYSACLLVRSLRVEGAMIEFTETHFFDKRISTQAIPWSGIEWQPVYAKSGSIQIDVDKQFEHLLCRSIGDRFSAVFCGLLGFPRYTVSPLATGYSIYELKKVFSGYKAALK